MKPNRKHSQAVVLVGLIRDSYPAAPLHAAVCREVLMKRFSILFLVLAISLAGQAAPQGMGSIRGVVTDSTGGPLPGVTVTLTPSGKSSVTDAQGRYSFVVAPGSYSIVARLEGLIPAQQRIDVRAGAVTATNLVLRVASVSEAITVTAASPSFRWTRTLSNSIANRDITIPVARSMASSTRASSSGAAAGTPIATLRLRYKEPNSRKSVPMTTSIIDERRSAYEASPDMQFAAAIAQFGMLLRDSPHKGGASWDDVLKLAQVARGADLQGTREEFLRIAQAAKEMR